MKSRKNLSLCLLLVIVFRTITLNDKVKPYAPLLTKKGIEEKNNGHMLKALKHFNKALYHDSNYINGIFQLISIEPDEIKRRNLIHQLAISNERRTYYTPAIFSLGMFYLKNKEYKTANFYFIKAIYNHPFYPAPTYYSGIAFFKQGDWERVLTSYNRFKTIPSNFNPAPWAEKLKTETGIE